MNNADIYLRPVLFLGAAFAMRLTGEFLRFESTVRKLDVVVTGASGDAGSAQSLTIVLNRTTPGRFVSGVVDQQAVGSVAKPLTRIQALQSRDSTPT